VLSTFDSCTVENVWYDVKFAKVIWQNVPEFQKLGPRSQVRGYARRLKMI